MITALLVISLIANVCLFAVTFVLWRKHWGFASALEKLASQLAIHHRSLVSLSQRDIMSNDPTVVAFVKHIGAALRLIDVAITHASENTEDEDTEKTAEENESAV